MPPHGGAESWKALREKLPNLTQPVELRYLPLAPRDPSRSKRCTKDLASLQSVRSFREIKETLEPGLDTLILNAGVMALPSKKRTEDGYEYQSPGR